MIFKVRRHWQWLRFLSLIISNEMGVCASRKMPPHPTPLQSQLTASPSLGCRPAHSSRLLFHTFIKRTLRDGDSGGSTLMPLSKAKLLGVFASSSFSSGPPPSPRLSFPNPPSLFLETTLPILCIFPTILKET